MDFVSKKQLLKLKKKKQGDKALCKAIDDLISDIEKSDWKTKEEVKAARPDADQVHTDGFYFFNIEVHRTLVLLEFEEDGSANVVWAGDHDAYERIFKNDKNVIAKWLKERELI